MKRLTLKSINKEIQKEYPKVELYRGNGYFYLHSEDESIGIMLSSKECTSIYVNTLNEYPLDRWLSDTRAIMASE